MSFLKKSKNVKKKDDRRNSKKDIFSEKTNFKLFSPFRLPV
jgi:hypothetical protein